MRSILFIAALLSLALLISCSSQPQLMKASVEPEMAAPGASANVSIEFSGTHADMKQVYLTVREYPYDFPMVELYPDNSSTSNLWTLDMTIPYEAYPGEYHLDINAFLKDGGEIVSEGFEDNSTGKAGTIILKVK
jgi:hypothetical protein